MPIEQALAENPWLQVCERVAQRQGFFHWELDFAPVFAKAAASTSNSVTHPGCGPTADVTALLAEGDPWWGLTNKPSETLITVKRA